MTEALLVRAEGLGKKFKIYPTPWQRGIEWLTGRPRHADFWALRDVSFGLERGECLGVIGPNGSGKTTLLRLLSRVLTPTEGRFQVGASAVYSLLELGTGFHPDLTGRDNVRQSARLLGLPDEHLGADTVEDIRRFADIGEYFDRPIRYYSSGMLVRLGFSMFAFLKPELLIVDEALSVGDVFFQQQCVSRIDELRASGTSFLFVSHDMPAVRRLCREAIVLERGRVVFHGPAEAAINRYHALLFPRDGRRSAPYLRERPVDRQAGMTAAEVRAGDVLARMGHRGHGSRGVEMLAARITDESGADTLSAGVKEVLRVDLLLVAHEEVGTLSAGLGITDRLGNLVFSGGTGQRGHRLPPLRPGESLVVRLSVRLSVQPGQYSLMLGVSELGHPHDWREGLGPIEVYPREPGPLPFHGMAELPLETRHGVVEAAEPAGKARRE